MNTTNILDHFSALEDPRQYWKVLYPLPEILLVVLCGVMAGADDFVEIERWGKRKLEYLRRHLPYKDGICSHDTLNDVMNALPGELFSDCFTNWVSALRDQDPEIVAIDGKTSRRAHARNGPRLHLVSAWASRQRLVLGQEPCDEKENEISAIPRLLERLELTGALVTIDAMGCQHDIAQAILVKGADYLLALKGNQKSLHNEVALFFDVVRNLDSHTTTDADHGRIETRRAHVCHAVDWLNADRAAPGEPRFAGLTTIGMVEAEVEKHGETSHSRRFYISSAHLTAVQLLRAARAHWGIENCLHWVMDVVFHDDLMRLRTQNGP
ncbi:MAG: ISAs1 family transposase, partial [Gammaproteobacteria bacterium]|nr:ISAs1 family transposase [Gammaproteobacteria bacterium]